MNRTITITELKQIFQFLEQKRVRHYDLQVELADHLASSIEVQWTQSPELSLKEALSNEYDKFGLFGFSKLVEKRQRSIGKKLFFQLNRQILAWLSFPKMLPLLAFIIVWAQLLQESQITEYLLIGMMALGLIVLLYGVIKQRLFMRKMEKKFLFMEAQIALFFIGLNVFYLPIHFINIFQFEIQHMSFGLAHLTALISAYFLLYCYELAFIQSKKKRAEAGQIMMINQLALEA
ncbi:MAG: hypothetical protein Sapg2KO_25700 [Saprospiraceae bacterium]